MTTQDTYETLVLLGDEDGRPGPHRSVTITITTIQHGPVRLSPRFIMVQPRGSRSRNENGERANATATITDY